MWRSASQVIFLLEEGELGTIVFSLFYLLKLTKLVMAIMVFTSMILYTMVPRLHARHLIMNLFVRRVRRRPVLVPLSLSV
jgi:hypothetical protein